jgi:hypothetical protein
MEILLYMPPGTAEAPQRDFDEGDRQHYQPSSTSITSQSRVANADYSYIGMPRTEEPQGARSALLSYRLVIFQRLSMITKLEGPLRRELSIEGSPYVLTITPTGFLLTQKGRRKGYEMDWRAFVSGETALATALTASLASAPPTRRRNETAAAPAARDQPQPSSPARRKVRTAR